MVHHHYGSLLLCGLMINLITVESAPWPDWQTKSAAVDNLNRDRRSISPRMSSSFGSNISPGIVQSSSGNSGAAAPPPEGDKTTTPSTDSTETTTEEEFEGDTGGSDVINTLLSIGGALLNFFQDPSQAVSQLVETAKNMLKAGRSLAARGPEYIQSAKSLLEEANRLLETARRISLQSQGLVGTAQNVARNVLRRPWILPG